MKLLCRWLGRVGMLCVPTGQLWAGGSGLNVVVVVITNSSNSVQLGNYYAERRQVPPQNYLRIGWTGGNVDWTDSDFVTYLYNPLMSMLSNRQLTNQIDYVVLSMDIPYRVNSGASEPNSTTSALFYGFKADANPPCSMAAGSTNLYAGSEGIFHSTPPISANSNSFLVTMITHSNLALAKQIVDSGALSDGTFPTQTVYLAKSTDPFRNVRYWTFDNAIFNTRLRGNYSMQRTNTDSNWSFGNCLGLQQGVQREISVPGTAFVPGSMADDLTSYGGAIFEPADHLKVLQYLAFGAAGGYGTVTEPCNYLEKFASPQNYFYQSRGFSLGECYYQSLTNPYQGVIVGEPLAAPFAKPPGASWNNLPTNALLSGTTNLTLQATVSDAAHPIQQVELFLDGIYLQTLTNIPPQTNNIVHVTLNGFPTNYTVPAGATIKSVASNLTVRLNGSAFSNATKVRAYVHGDRIELQSTDITRPAAQMSLTVSNSIGTAAALTTFLAASGPSFLDSIAHGIKSCSVTNIPQLGSYLQLSVAKTNGQMVTTSVTNTLSGTTLGQLAKALFDAVNTNAALQSPDGVTVEDIVAHEDYAFAFGPDDHSVDFNLTATGIGGPASQLQFQLSGSGIFAFQPSGSSHLDDNLPDLQPRSHIYITAGVTNLPLTFALNTTSLANGFHVLTAVVYEGSHVRTQKRLSGNVVIQNGPLSATFVALTGDTNTAVEAALQFSVTANTNNIAQIELFSTGGSIGIVTGQSNALFNVAATTLDLGLHPFYAVVTAQNGKQFRTDTKWFRIVGADLPFTVSITAPAPTLVWPAAAGRSYDVISTTSLTNAFQVRATVVPTNSLGQWSETDSTAMQRFYRLRTTN